MLIGYRTYIGIGISLLGVVGNIFGKDLSWIANSQADIVSMAGLAIATYGRAKVGK